MERLTGQDFCSIMSSLRALMDENKDYLIDLDSAMGNGDLGLSMTAAFNKADEELKKLEEADIGKLCMRTGMVIAKGAPSTMGTLIATGFMRAGKVLKDKTEIQLSDISEMMKAFLEGLMERGKAKPGEKTIIDSFSPAARALEEAVKYNKGLQEGLKAAYEASVRGVDETKNMKAQRGRGAYYGEKSLGKQDPGATVGMFIIKAFYDYVT